MGPLPAEVAVPLVAARIEQRRELPRLRLQAGDVRSLERIAVKAAKGEVAGHGRPLVLSGDDVVDLERAVVVFLRHAAVFAAGTGPQPDLPDKCCVHERLRTW